MSPPSSTGSRHGTIVGRDIHVVIEQRDDGVPYRKRPVRVSQARDRVVPSSKILIAGAAGTGVSHEGYLFPGRGRPDQARGRAALPVAREEPARTSADFAIRSPRMDSEVKAPTVLGGAVVEWLADQGLVGNAPAG